MPYRKFILQLVVLVAGAVVLVSVVHLVIAQPFVVSGDSMLPNFSPGDYLVIDELSYYRHAPERGDVVVFRYPVDPSLFFIKRLVGIPGDTIEVRSDGRVVVEASGTPPELLDEPYILTATSTEATSTITLGPDEYYVLGDNRDTSFDSRAWGPVPGRYIIGDAVARLYPFGTMGLFPGRFPLSETPLSSTSAATIHS